MTVPRGHPLARSVATTSGVCGLACARVSCETIETGMAPALSSHPQCLDEAVAAAYVGGALTPDEVARVETHVDACPPCRQYVSALARLDVSHSTASATASATAPTQDGTIPRGTRIGRYVVDVPVGRGGMGVVYVADDPKLNRRVALKRLARDFVGASQEGLLREAQAMARLSHPNVVVVHDVILAGEMSFIAMEYVEGVTLRTWLDAEPRTWRRIVSAFVQAGRGLAAAHAVGLVHRDFKPANVLCDSSGRVRVTDFGLARFARTVDADASTEGDLGEREVPRLLLSATATGAIAGTPAYMSPEGHCGESVDGRSDQFSYCVALYEALYRVRPFGDGKELVARVIDGKLRDPPAQSEVPARIRNVLVRGLARAPAERFPSMEALLADLEREPRSRWKRGAVAALAVASLASIGLAYRNRGAEAAKACIGSGRALAGVWDEGLEGRASRSFSAVGKPYAPDAWRGVKSALDAYSRDLDRCPDRRVRAPLGVRREQSSELLDSRLACLDRRLDEMRGLSTIFADADDAIVVRAVEAAKSLTPVTECTAWQVLGRRIAPPRDPQTRAKVEGIRKDLAELKALDDAGLYKDAVPRMERALEAAHAVDYGPVLGEALLRAGIASEHSGDDARAASRLFLAASTADAAGDDRTRAEASWHLVHVVGYTQSKPENGSDAPRCRDGRHPQAGWRRRPRRRSYSIVSGSCPSANTNSRRRVSPREGSRAFGSGWTVRKAKTLPLPS